MTMERKDTRKYSLAELANQAGISPRTVRFYISRGLLPGPVKAGRYAAYTHKHLARLKKVKNLQKQGLSLHEVVMSGKQTIEQLPEPVTWTSFQLADDVLLSVRAGISPWRMQQIKKAMYRILPRIQTPK